VTALVLDAGALIALDRNDRVAWATLRISADDASTVQVPAGVIAQAWRDGRRQALLSRALTHCDEVPLDGAVARAAGLLCGRAGTADVIDASVALTAAGIARHDDVAVIASDPDDIRRLLSVLDVAARVVHV
jgi:hypothetical protein